MIIRSLRKISKEVRILAQSDIWMKLAIRLSCLDHRVKLHSGGKLEFVKTGLVLKKGQFLFFLENYDYANALTEKIGFIFFIEDNRLFAESDGLKFEIQTGEELFILNEIFVDKIYNLIPVSERLVVVDVGMNVGFSSIYFASKSYVKRVYSYEPIPATFSQGLKNIELNSSVSEKIKTFQFGIGDSGRDSFMQYDASQKGVSKEASSDSGGERVRIEDVSAVFHDIFQKVEEGEALMIKLDCEGAEYEILRKLHVSSLIKSPIKYFAIEWHEEEPEELIGILRENGFSVFETHRIGNEVGMVYAFRET